MKQVAVIGGRGYTGSELVPLLWRHPEFELTAVGSRSAAGQAVSGLMDGMEDCPLSFTEIRADQVGEYPADAYVLALPNGQAAQYVEAIDRAHADAVIIDLSADYRFNPRWAYGLPELRRDDLPGASRISNPGCYATAYQLILAPLAKLLSDTPVGFGVSGYSGAGRTPSRRNDTAALKDNLMPYTLNDHVHEREVSYQLGRTVRFLPHVASFFRGINLTSALALKTPLNGEQLCELYSDFYHESRLIEVQPGIPEVMQIAGRHGAVIGGFSVGREQPRLVSVVGVLDNLLKGAATQAVQNLNIVFGMEELTGIPL